MTDKLYNLRLSHLCLVNSFLINIEADFGA
jgi:hypothetical protein